MGHVTSCGADVANLTTVDGCSHELQITVMPGYVDRLRSPSELTTVFRSQGLKLTPQRQLLFRLLHGNVTHPSAAHARCRIVTDSTPTCDAHHHTICRLCGEVRDVYLTDDTQPHVHELAGFVVNSAAVLLHGTCAQCLASVVEANPTKFGTTAEPDNRRNNKENST